MSTITELIVNGTSFMIDAAADQPLLSILRESLGLTGCKIGCGEGECGACTVLVDDQVTRSCITPVGNCAGLLVRTIEGLEVDGRLHPLQQAFLDQDALQCGYCTPGMIMSALGLLQHSNDPSAQAIVEAMQGNICRCGAYPRIVQAIQQAAAELRAEDATGGGR
jgi:aerobic-type carbon monoxide dehydrogenase small subunit (CoxS/CutS family)